MTDFQNVLLAVAPHGKPAIRNGFAAALPDCIFRASLTTELRLAHFLAQCAHESAGLATMTEYASGKAYEGRKDLGNTQAGDGVHFKGRGLIQLTGRANYKAAGDALGLPLETNPTRAGDFPDAALTAAWFWKQKGLGALADKDDIEGVTRCVNGGLNGLASRKAYLAKAKAALADLKGALTAGAAQEAAKAKAQGATGVGGVAPSPGRKTDPGSAYPLDLVRSRILGRQ
ncbi:glycoside hydrolase family 19 protein [Rhodoblastus sp. 17X3]|uniref:glycoside hydrolase family 19 protein n=1 Tax=Rhodoblastus sp. 17X3 TaxID=3047026 RepID=UPI0024B84DFE|nr:glycoside hydrolase family 19 protein [Rhodoblastus sp. 17X3]MDI9847574.1 glycoside hydrolase family 19 protein [Rhodoblastus sp. 17X3]